MCQGSGVQFKIPNGHVDLTRRTILLNGRTSELTPLEADFLAILLEAEGKTVDTHTLLAKVWKANPKVNTRAPAFSAYRLRPKLELNPADPRVLITDYGRGFRLQAKPFDGSLAPLETGPPASRYRDAFIGRTSLLEQLATASDRPLVVITGAPGVGKTRLVDAFLTASQRSFRWFDLESAGSDQKAWNSVVSEPVEVVVFDGADAHSAAIRRWWDEVQDEVGFQLFVTRAAPLGVPGEKVIEVPPLPLDEARRLFFSRLPDGLSSDPDPTGLSELLQAFECLPLAVELAAARSAQANPAQQLEMLDGPEPADSRLHSALKSHLTHIGPTSNDTLEWLAQFPAGIAEDDALTSLESDQLTAIERLSSHHLLEFQEGRIRVPRWIRSALLGFLNPERRTELEHRRMRWVDNARRAAPDKLAWFHREMVNVLTILEADLPNVDLAEQIVSASRYAWDAELRFTAASAWARWSGSNTARAHRLRAQIILADSGTADATFKEDQHWFLSERPALPPGLCTSVWMALAGWAQLHGNLEMAETYLQQAASALPAGEPELEVQLSWRRAALADSRLDEDGAVTETTRAWRAAQHCERRVQRLAEQARADALANAGRGNEALAFITALSMPNDDRALAATRLSILIENDQLAAAAQVLESLPPSFGYSARLRLALTTNDLTQAQALLETLRPSSALERLSRGLAQAALLREAGHAQDAASLLEKLLSQPRFPVGRRLLIPELLLAHHALGEPRAEALARDMATELSPRRAAIWATLWDGKDTPVVENFFFSKRWVDAKRLLCRPRSP